MSSHTLESTLQAIATDLAFLAPGSAHVLLPIALALEALDRDFFDGSLQHTPSDFTQSLSLCRDIVAANDGVTQAQLDRLNAQFENMSAQLYMAPSHRPELAPPPAPSEPDEAVHSAQESFSLKEGDDHEMLNEFCTEGREMLRQMEQGVLTLEENPLHKDTLNQVFRVFHNFKGGAGFLGIAPIKDLAHQLESLLDAARRDELRITQAVIESILAGGDALQSYIDAIELQLSDEHLRGQPISVPTAQLLFKIQTHLGTAPTSLEMASTGPESPATQGLAASALPPVVALPVAARPDPPAMETRPPATTPPLQTDQALVPQAVPKPPSKSEALANYVRLDTRKLDALVDLMGELVIAQSMVVQHPQVQNLHDRELDRHLRQLARITADLQHNAMSLRMVPIRSVFQKMTRLVRDLATAQNKQIQLHLSGEDTELDRNIVEELADPLLHMLRNAVDHGIESSADRVANGKNPQGNIHLHASQLGGGIFIRLQDDGKGLDERKILAKARQRGWVPHDGPVHDKDIFKLIFLPGFSTADTVTDISGRGVGMDVVNGSIKKLRGRVDIDSSPGEGTVFSIFLPLTLAIIDGMLVGIGQERFILPTLTIRESLRPQQGMVTTVQGKGEVISVRGKLIPLVRLSDKLGVQPIATEPCDGIVVVVDSGGRTRALLVDSLIGKQEVVIKPLGETFKHHKGMSGAAIMGDGKVALIIDPDVICQVPNVEQI
jgi:two-component system chemotaxis sensor kinase CheA